MPTEAEPTLASGFPEATLDQWLALVDKVLKGAPLSTLDSVTPGGLTVHPLYRREDLGDPPRHGSRPGRPPFTRGPIATRADSTAWAIRSLVDSPDPIDAAKLAVRGLERGATELLVRFDAAFRGGTAPQSPEFRDLGGVDGVLVTTTDGLATALEGVLVDLAPIHLQAGSQFARAADLMISVWERKGVPAKVARGGIGGDPIGHLAAEGLLPQGIGAALVELGSLAANLASTYPGVTAVRVDTSPYVEAGASEVQELALMLSTGAAYLRALGGGGLDIDRACAQIEVTLCTDADVFTGIAKLRAARRLWSAMTAACGASDRAQSLRMHVNTARPMMTTRDPWVNLLRVTAAAFAAGVGGTSSMTTAAYDSELGESDELARRLARNTQLLLQEESNIGRVVDPIGGSWYVESLTDEIARAAWAEFQDLESSGGLPGALLDGTVAERITKVRDERLERVALRLDPITGVSEFPDIDENPESKAAPDLRTLRSSAVGSDVVGDVYSTSSEPTRCDPLVRVRWSEQFEELRDGSDAYKAATGARPKVFLVNLGPVATHTARATFAKNFFESGGIEAVTSHSGSTTGFDDPGVAVGDAMASGAHLVCICSSDALYADRGEEFAAALTNAGMSPLYLAGDPGDRRGALLDAGIDEFIHTGVNVLEILRRAHTSIGTPSGTVRR